MNVLAKPQMTHPVTGSVGQGQAPSCESAQVGLLVQEQKEALMTARSNKEKKGRNTVTHVKFLLPNLPIRDGREPGVLHRNVPSTWQKRGIGRSVPNL